MTGRADMELVRRVLDETGVERTVSSPGWYGYLVALVEAAVDALQRRLPGLRRLSALPEALGPVATVVLALVVGWIVFMLLRIALGARRGRGTPAAAPAESLPPPHAIPELDRRGWRAELDRRLAAGDIARALEALWWWFARAVSASGVDPSWTSRELLARTGRTDLNPLAVALDRLLYGPARPSADDLRGFVRRGEEVLP